MSRRICVCLEFLNNSLRQTLRDAARRAGFEIRFFTGEELSAAEEYLQGCEVLFAHSPELLGTAPASLRWYHCAFAGVDPYCAEPSPFKNPACLFTNSAGAYGDAIAEHLVMVLLMLMRRMNDYMEDFRARRWGGDLPFRSILGSEVTVLGTGDVGGAFARRLRALGCARVTGLSRSGAPRPDFDEVLPIARLDEVLPRAHVLAMALPGTAGTAGILSERRIALLPADALVLNVGRGTAVDQDALMSALNAGKIAGAALDVMTPEPLPPESPLWTAKNLILTPHVSGNMALAATCRAVVDGFCENLARYAAGEPLLHQVNRELGY